MPKRISCFFVWAILSWMVSNSYANGNETLLSVRWQDGYESISKALELPVNEHMEGKRFTRQAYPAFEALEWQVRLKPSTDTVYADKALLESAQWEIELATSEHLELRWSEGSHAQPSDFRPNIERLMLGKPVQLRSFGGRSSDGVMPFFQVGNDQGGFIIAIGWSGDWEASFELKPQGRIAFHAGLQRANFRLRKDQEVRLPSVLLMRYAGPSEKGINQFRSLMLEHFSPQHLERDELMPVAGSVHGMLGFNDTTEEKLISIATRLSEIKLPLDTYWLDAGWSEGGFPAKQGNTMPDTQRFPRGLRPVADLTHQNQQRFLLWFEPERVMRDTELMRDHPNWLMVPKGTPEELRYQEVDGFHLFDMGNEVARRWMLERVSKQITDYGVDIYRQDCNLYPAYYWGNALVTTAQEPNSQEPNAKILSKDVSSEVEYVTGLYEFLDELQARHPQLLIDNCASGGRRVDFEMLRRSVLLWRSDCTWGDVSSPRNMQAMTYGLSFWLPLHGLGAVGTDPISLRSGMGYCASYAIPFGSEHDVQRLRDHLARFLRIRALFSKDFYPLTPWTLKNNEWIAWQFDDAEKGRGLIQVFRGVTDQGGKEVRLFPRGLQEAALYQVSDWDQEKTETKMGGEWMRAGWVCTADETQNVARVIEYRRMDSGESGDSK